jgi:hypothetical protein
VSARPAPSATYVYCVAPRRRAPSLRRAPAGMPGTGRPRALDAGDGLFLVACDAPLDRYGEAALERGLRDLDWVSACAVAHDAVVEHVGRVGTVVPMRLFTLFASDARALAHVARERRRIERAAARVAGRAEWVARVVLDEARARARRRAPGRAGAGRGTAFLLRKKGEREALGRAAASAQAAAERLYETLAGRAADARRRPPLRAPGGGRHLLLDAAFLVPRRGAAAFRAAARRAGAPLGKAGCEVTVTGPWPPYSFVDDNA